MEQERIAKTLVKPKGIFDWKDFYKFLYELMQAQGYVITEDHYNQKETKNGKEIEVQWNCSQFIDDYTRFDVQLLLKVFGLVDVQIERGGQKKDMNQGEIEVWITGFITTDYKNQWEKQPILKFLKGVYDRYLYRSRYEELQAKMWEHVYLIENEVKAYFELPRFM